MAASKAWRDWRSTRAGARGPSAQTGAGPSQKPKTAPSRSAAIAARPLPSGSGPTASVAPRSRMRSAVASAPGTAKYGIQAAGGPPAGQPPMPATALP